MSLINEALKKAQKQRSGEAPPLASMPAIGGEPAARIARGAKASFIPFVIAGSAGVAALGLAGFFLLRDRPAAAAPNPAAAVAAPAPATPATTTAPAAPTPAAPAPKTAENTFVLPIAAPPPAAPAAAPATPAPAVTASAPEPGPPPPAETRNPEPGRLDSRAIQFIDGIKVAGIRAAGTDSKVLMNDRVYRIGDVVEYDLGLRLVGITAGSLTFEDARGARHTRNF